MLVAIGAGLALVTVSDGFVYLLLQRRLDFDENLLPLLYIGTALSYMLLAIPTGYVAVGSAAPASSSRATRCCCSSTACSSSPEAGALQLVACLVLFGAYYAATDGMLMAIAGSLCRRRCSAPGWRCS